MVFQGYCSINHKLLKRSDLIEIKGRNIYSCNKCYLIFPLKRIYKITFPLNMKYGNAYDYINTICAECYMYAKQVIERRCMTQLLALNTITSAQPDLYMDLKISYKSNSPKYIFQDQLL